MLWWNKLIDKKMIRKALACKNNHKLLFFQELNNSLSHLAERFRLVAGGVNDQELYFKIPSLWKEIDDRTIYANRLR